MTDKFECFRCGVCCSLYQVKIDLYEAGTIASRLNISREEFLSTYTDPRWPGKETFLIRHRDGGCIFLTRQEGNSMVTKCMIHAFRPGDCRQWAAEVFKPECRKGLSEWRLEVDTNGELSGSTEDLERFSFFLDSLKPD